LLLMRQQRALTVTTQIQMHLAKRLVTMLHLTAMLTQMHVHVFLVLLAYQHLRVLAVMAATTAFLKLVTNTTYLV
jgi:hypothetical protein